jgi:hypothetical protein
LIVDLRHFCVFEDFAKNLFNLVDVRLAFGEGPATELQAEVFEVDMTEFCSQRKH